MKYNSKTISLFSIMVAFFMWGLLTSLNDILIPHLKSLFNLSYTKVMLVQFVFFATYAILSIPMAKILAWLGYKKGIILGFFLSGLGCLCFIPAASFAIYNLFLLSLIILAAGIVMLQVSAQPYVSLLGEKETASSRLTFANGLNSLGTTIAPWIGGVVILGAIAAAGSNTELIARAIQKPYLVLAIMMFILSIIFIFIPFKSLGNADPSESKADDNQAINQYKSIWKYKHLMLGCLGIFCYVGAEVSIGSFLVNYFELPNIMNLSPEKGAKYLAIFWGGVMIGRFLGAFVLQKLSPTKVLVFNGCLAIILVLTSMLSSGHVAMWSILAVGLFNSVLFPTIFSLAVRELRGQTKIGSGLLCVSIVGGGIIPLIQGSLADSVGIQNAFIIPVICYIYIIFYGIYGYDKNVVLA